MTKGLKIGCASQGLDEADLTPEQLTDWFQEELKFWEERHGLDENIVIDRQNYGRPYIVRDYTRKIRGIIEALENKDPTPASEFLKAANDLDAVLAHGNIAGEIQNRIAGGQLPAAQRIVMLFSESILELHGELRNQLILTKIALKLNPYGATTADLVSARKTKDAAEKTLKTTEAVLGGFQEEMSDEAASLREFIASTKKELGALHTQYEDYLVLQGPSRHWKAVAQRTWWVAMIALGIFIFLILSPAALVAYNWQSVSNYVDHVVTISNGTFSLASLLVFTIPLFAYGWLLKHISRVFNQNLVVSADAEHRRVMAVTFLGLAKRKSVAISPEDRALVLNAMFRPSPLAPHDDGPPVGLLELMKGK